ncbi:hypothetical protein BD560DRAFT_492425 [Blakeslea trispora]|nr:hypothetical protein BD560DRAFT_492425 [Blakeslea trispora]
MGLKKLFTHKDDNEKKLNYDQKRNLSKSSSLSISSWSHKDKKRHSSIIPSPSLSNHTLQMHQNTRENKVTQRHSMYNPVISTRSPITPSESFGEVNEVVDILRNSSSSEFSSFTTSGSNEDICFSPEPFAESTGDSNKYEIVLEDPQEENAFHSLLYQNGRVTPDSATAYTKKETEDSLYTELLLVQQQLNAINPTHAAEVKKQIGHVNDLLNKAVESSIHLETKVRTIVQSSKETIMVMDRDNKWLKKENQKTKAEMEQTMSLLVELRSNHAAMQAQSYKTETQLQDMALLLHCPVDDLPEQLKNAVKLNQQLEQDKLEYMKQSEMDIQQKQEQLARMEQEHADVKLKLASCTTQNKELEEEKEELLAQIEKAKELENKVETLEAENKQLKDDLVVIENVSREAAQSVMDENERLEHQLQQLELLYSGNDEEVEHLCDNTSKRVLVADNRQLKSKLKVLEQAQAENTSLTELVGCLQSRIKELEHKHTISNHLLPKSIPEAEQEELMRMHTRAQLGLIEFLEGEDNITAAMTKFKRQLEADMKEFTSTDADYPICSTVSVSESMR